MLLATLANRIRKQRKERKYTQADLAQRAGVSTRFLAQLESGSGNISVQRLADICSALSLSMAELFQGLGPHGPLVLSLVGLRGAGKSTLGKLVANSLSIPLVELDQEIVSRSAMGLAEIFSFGGAEFYHEWQERVLRDILKTPKPIVLATGGSIVRSTVSWDRLLNYSKTVWLYAEPISYLRRVREQGDFRPMAGYDNALSEIEQLLRIREPLYAQAALHLDTDARSKEELVEDLIFFYRNSE